MNLEQQLLLLEIGEGNSESLQNAVANLSGAQNSVINALVSHTTTRLDFWANLGILYINDDGQWSTPGYNYEETVLAAETSASAEESLDIEESF